MELFEEFFKIVRKLNKSRVQYAIVGGIAMSFYDQPRYTKDIDILTIPKELTKINNILSSLGYEESAQPWKFNKTRITLYRYAKIENKIVLPLDILSGEEAFHQQILKNAKRVKSENGIVRIADKADLIALKSIRNSRQDRIDIDKLGQGYYDETRPNDKRP
jgi:predicted nucleotidyltransferase